MKKLWTASKNTKINSNLYSFEKFISQKYSLNLKKKLSKNIKMEH